MDPLSRYAISRMTYAGVRGAQRGSVMAWEGGRMGWKMENEQWEWVESGQWRIQGHVGRVPPPPMTWGTLSKVSYALYTILYNPYLQSKSDF